MERNHHIKFATRWGFLLSAVGSAVGMANVWGFPAKMGSYGGGAFLVAYLFFIALFALIPQGGWIDDIFLKCGMCVAAMPMGLNTIVIPAAYGKDTTDAAGLALVSHVFSILTIPLAFMLLQKFIL